MSSVRFVFPKLNLTKLLRAPGGLSVADALARAEANLESLRPTCRAELVSLMELTEAAYERLPAAFDDAGLGDIYAIAVRGIGTGKVSGAPAVDDVLGSLCELIDELRTTKRLDREAVGVHIRSWRLLMSPDLPSGGQEAVLSGLRKVSARYSV